MMKTKRSPARVTAVLILALALGACTAARELEKDKAPGVSVNLAGFPPEYRKAYGDGCAHARGGGAQAPAFPQGAQQAAQGWRDGFDYCKRNPR